MTPLTLIGHVTMVLFALGMIGFFLMIFKGVKKEKKKGRKASKRLRKFKLWLKNFEEFKKGWFYEI
jgi:flagellar basal body-associated protein FliL